MPVIAVNVVKVLFALALYGFLFYMARAMRSHVARPPVDPQSTPTPPARRMRATDPPPSPKIPVLEIIAPGGAVTTVALAGRVILGRGSSADVQLDDEYASDRHAAFSVEGATVWVEDLDSTNGTTIDGTRIEGKVAIDIGSRVIVGRTPVVVR